MIDNNNYLLKSLRNKSPHLIDTHCHFQYFSQNTLLDTFKRAYDYNVKTIFNISVNGTDGKDFVKNNKFEDINIFYSVGRHPSEANNTYSYNDILRDKENSIAIGETGLDFYHKTNPSYNVQVENFLNHTEAAIDSDLPVIIHSRNAFKEIHQLLSDRKNINRLPRFIIHSFSGNIDDARKLIDLGGYLSFSGIVTYKSAKDTMDALRFCPINRLLLETDSPYLCPDQWRKSFSRNEPAFMEEVFRYIVFLKNVNPEDIIYNTYINSIDCFGHSF